METKKWKINKSGIIRSLKSVIKNKDITKLTKDAYNFTMNISGFIAHYNHQGFMSNYENVADLVEDLKRSSDISNAERYINDRWFSENEQKEWYRAKSEILMAIRDMVENIEVKERDEVVKFTRLVKSY